MLPLAEAISDASNKISTCSSCGNVDAMNPCHICAAPGRDQTLICVVQDVGDLWAMERAGAFKGQYHVLGGTLSALDGIRPEDLNIAGLIIRAKNADVKEVILAMNTVSRLAHGVPVGGELDYLDDGTITAAMKSRRPF